MIRSCPRCATQLDPATSICGSCLWSASYFVRSKPPTKRDMSFAERYRGTEYEVQQTSAAFSDTGIARGRMFVMVALVATFSLFGLVILSQPGL